MKRSGYEIIEENGLFGLADSNGKRVVPCVYDKIPDYDDDGYIRLLKGEVYSTITIDGKEAIPLSKGLTHLGVFYGGTARARKGECWGLVDEVGDAVTDFCYTQISAHRKNGYFAIDKDGIRGWLLEDGTFSPFEKQSGGGGKKSKFQDVRVFHNGIAPAYTWDEQWVFVDEQLNRVNDIKYRWLDPVLRNGIYSIFKQEGLNHYYGAAFYDGRPLVDIWFDSPIHFENAVAVCCKKRLDTNGKEISIPYNGQPLCDYGVLQSNGEWLFPMEYTNLHWNDYEEKDCWFAEDDKACYLLFPDGSRKIYNKIRAIRRGSALPYIPKSEMKNEITEWELQNTYKPQIVDEKHLRLFNTRDFGQSVINFREKYGYYSSLRIFYRDTDAVFDGAYYREGTVVRAGDFLEATDKLLRPVHKTRFMIAIPYLFSIENFMASSRASVNPFPFKEYIIHSNTYFVVLDSYTYFGKRQILLLMIPHGAFLLGNKHGYNWKKLGEICKYDGMPLITFSRYNFRQCMSRPAHGHSLSKEWVRAMHQPIGLKESMKPVSLVRDEQSRLRLPKGKEYAELAFAEEYGSHSCDYDYVWYDFRYILRQDNPIRVVVGDITRLRVDAIVNAANRSLLGGGGVDGAIHRAAGRKLLEECKKLYGCQTGESKLTDAYQLPCKKIIHTVGPRWHGGDRDEDRLLYSCYRTAFDLAIRNNLKSIAFPCISTGVYHFPFERAAKIAIAVMKEYLQEEKYDGEIIICCFRDEDAAIYRNLLAGEKCFQD